MGGVADVNKHFLKQPDAGGLNKPPGYEFFLSCFSPGCILFVFEIFPQFV